MSTKNHLKLAFSKVEGGVPAIASACDVSPRAVYKWINRQMLPRTDYTGETRYSSIISGLPGADFTDKELLYPHNNPCDQAA